MTFFLVRPALSSGAYYRTRPAGTTNDYWWLILLAFVPYAAAIRSWRRGRTIPTRVLLMVAIVAFVGFIPAPAQQSQDVYQYLVYGRTAAQGGNPYSDVTHARDEWTDHALWRGTRSAYGPIWTAASEGIVRLSGTRLTKAFLLIKGLAAVLAIATILLAARVTGSEAGRDSDGGLAVLTFAFNPLVLVSVGLGAHADIAVAAALASAVFLYGKGRPLGVTVALAVGALVKAYVGLVLLLWVTHVLKRHGVKRAAAHAALVGGLSAAAFAPYWKGLRTFAGLSEVSRLASASLTGGLMRLFSGRWNSGAGLTTVGTAVRIVAAAVLLFALLRLARSAGERPMETMASLFAVYVIVSPWFLPWHLLGLIVFSAVLSGWRGSDPTIIFSASSLVVLPGGLQTAVRYGPLLLWARRNPERTWKLDRTEGTESHA
jgi:uncharacterized membrane protein